MVTLSSVVNIIQRGNLEIKCSKFSTDIPCIIRHCALVGSARTWDGFLAVSDIYPMSIEPTITWFPSGFSGYIWLDTKIVLKKITRQYS